ncbi:hypothetical protein SBRCBS47491_007686 [Sporothrix bragantina]|uniref:Chitin-binding type-1 domain-containing protein n=1 Tax=Sporothrix bragantina TaxID=671064 RepID=A0ABP0CHQ7_9PEZI
MTSTHRPRLSGWLAALLAFSTSPVNAASTASTCNLTVAAQEGDTCASLANTWHITVTAFVQNNPGISSCANLTVGASYCIDAEAHGGGTTSSNPSNPSGSKGGSSPTSSPPPNKVTLDGTCGSGYTCTGSKYGTCCSAHGWCGSTVDHCGAGCQADFGTCEVPVTGNGTTTSVAPPPPVTTPGTTSPPASSPPGSVSQVTQVKTVWTTLTTTRTTTTTTTTTAWVTNTAYATNIANVTNTAMVTRTQTWTAVATVSTVLTSTALTTETLHNTAMVTRTTTTTQTRIDVSIITTITTVTLVVSITDRNHLASMCAQTLAHTPQSAGGPVTAMAAQTTEAPSIDARSPHTPPRILLEPCCGTEIVQCAASTPGLGDDERRSVSSMARRAAFSMPGMDVCCGALYNCL